MKDSNYVDMHIHTTCSDGSKKPEEVLKEAENLGLKIISITDHQSAGAYKEIEQHKEIFSGTIVPGIELKTVCKGREIELLGYGISTSDMERLLPTLYKSQEEIDKEYLEKIIDSLEEKSIRFPKGKKELVEDFLKNHKNTQPAKFITQTLFSDKSNLKHNFQVLYNDKVHHSNNESLYRGWLTNPKSIFYVDYNGYPNLEETIKLIKDCGGKVFIPHIFQYKNGLDILKTLISKNLSNISGIECYYPTFTKEQTNFLLNLCRKYNLFVSGGSDYHGINKENELGTGLNNNLHIPEEKITPWAISLSKGANNKSSETIYKDQESCPVI